MKNIKNTDWHDRWRKFYVDSVKEELEIEKTGYLLTESASGTKKIETLVDTEFQKFEKLLKKNVADLKKKIKKISKDNED